MSKPLTTPELQGSVDELYRRFAHAGRRYAMSILRNEADSEEAVQEAFLRITRTHEDWVERNLTEIDTLDVAGLLKARLFRAIRNLCIDQTRKRNRHPTKVSLDIVPDPPQSNGRENNESAFKHLIENIEQLMKQMNSDWADALRLKQNGELSYQQIATVLSTEERSVSHAQVRSWIFRGRRFLEHELKSRGLIEN